MAQVTHLVHELASLARPYLNSTQPAIARALVQRVSALPYSTLFGHVEAAPKDPILGITEKFLADTDPTKINLGVVRLRRHVAAAH